MQGGGLNRQSLYGRLLPEQAETARFSRGKTARACCAKGRLPEKGFSSAVFCGQTGQSRAAHLVCAGLRSGAAVFLDNSC